jgi:uncharacterized protein YjiS (DUF1127 family)
MPPRTETYRLPLALQAMKTDLGASPQWTELARKSGRVQRALAIGATAGALLLALADMLRSVYARWCQHRRARAMDAALRALDDRTLRDVGLHRVDISSVARAMAARDGDPSGSFRLPLF